MSRRNVDLLYKQELTDVKARAAAYSDGRKGHHRSRQGELDKGRKSAWLKGSSTGGIRKDK